MVIGKTALYREEKFMKSTPIMLGMSYEDDHDDELDQLSWCQESSSKADISMIVSIA